VNPGIYRPSSQIATPPQGLLGRPAVVPMPLGFVHPEAQDWAIRATANGGVVSSTVLTAVSDFCRAIDAAGIRDRFLRLNLFCGGNLSGGLVPLYRSASTAANPIGNATDVNVNFVSGDYAETGVNAGIKGNGIGKYLQTGLVASANLVATNVHLAVFLASPNTSSFNYPVIIGCKVVTPAASIQLWTATTSANTPATFDVGASNATSSTFNPSGFLVGSCVNQQDIRFFINGKQDSPTSTATFSVAATPALQLYVFATNQSGVAQILHNGRASTYSIGYGMTAFQVLEYHAALAAFRLALGRA